MVGSLFSSDAWNSVTFAAAEVKNPSRNLPLALVLGTGLVSLLYILANFSYLNVLPFDGVAEGANAMARGIRHATQDRVGTAVAETIFGPSGARAHGGRDPHLDLRLQQRIDPVGRASAATRWPAMASSSAGRGR